MLMDCTTCLVSQQVLNYTNVQTHFIRERDLILKKWQRERYTEVLRPFSVFSALPICQIRCRAWKGQELQTSRLKVPLLNCKDATMPKRRRPRQGAAFFTDSSNDELPAAAIRLSLAALQMHLLLHCAQRKRLHVNTVSVGVISSGCIWWSRPCATVSTAPWRRVGQWKYKFTHS